MDHDRWWCRRTQQRRCGCASRGARRPWRCGRGKPCGRKASCGGSSCWIRNRSNRHIRQHVVLLRILLPCPPRVSLSSRTLGIAAWPLKRRRTRLSIPLGLRHEGSTHLKRSLWWRLKRAVPVIHQILSAANSSRSFRVQRQQRVLMTSSVSPIVIIAFPSLVSIIVVRKARRPGGKDRIEGGLNVRFFTIGTCFLAETICTAIPSEQHSNNRRFLQYLTLSVFLGSSRVGRVVDCRRELRSRAPKFGGFGLRVEFRR